MVAPAVLASGLRVRAAVEGDGSGASDCCRGVCPCCREGWEPGASRSSRECAFLGRTCTLSGAARSGAGVGGGGDAGLGSDSDPIAAHAAAPDAGVLVEAGGTASSECLLRLLSSSLDHGPACDRGDCSYPVRRCRSDLPCAAGSAGLLRGALGVHHAASGDGCLRARPQCLRGEIPLPAVGWLLPACGIVRSVAAEAASREVPQASGMDAFRSCGVGFRGGDDRAESCLERRRDPFF